MSNTPPPDWRALADEASRWTLKTAKIAGAKGLELAKAAEKIAREKLARQRELAAERERTGAKETPWFVLRRKIHAYLADLLSPEAQTARKIARTHIPGSVFDVGEGGIHGHFMAMVGEHRGALAASFHGVAWLLLFFLLAQLSTDLTVPALVIVLLVPAGICFVMAWWNERAGRAYEKEWKALEALGPQWHFENGSYFRYIFQRDDGSFRIDPATREERLNIEIYGVRQRAEAQHQCQLQILIGIGWAVGACVVALAVGMFFHWHQLLSWHAPWVIGLVILWVNVPNPLVLWQATKEEQKAYERGNQFIPAPRVSDSLHEPLTLESVKAQSALGDAAFSSPEDASKGLGG